MPLIVTRPQKLRPEWDKQIKEDVKAGKLDDIARQVKEKYEEGRTSPL